jgi:DNA repair protein RecN (Recombination protein N)
LEKDNERLDLIYSLEKKHSVNSIKELLDIKQEISEKLKLNNDISSILEEKQIEKQQLVNHLQDLSNLLHKQRILSSKEIEEDVKPLLSQMAMKEAELKIEVNEVNDFTENGKDSVRFLFNANKTKERNLMEMSKVVSGGELSRLMLAIKAVICQRFSLPTMVFDEIDSGISGDIAAKVADIMCKIGEKHQVITITHLVQMAAKAKYQFKVYKQVENDETISNISLLNYDQRVNEIAMMLSNDKITKEAIANAKSLLG